MKKSPGAKRQIIGFTCGSFDLTHAGHYLMFEECKDNCDYLIVGLQTDPTLDRPEKNKPVQTLRERKIQLASCKYIDRIIIYRTEKDLYRL
ncbi:MAG TPA: adenylyltransferase/cytidyltransferase family protein, partial [Candidatus Paceibacterota bacterium]|nr:adenylyltransferase/cytidyltransferase family protein [Candidatus Paceibacterota bacterium]